jgi:hypothetical protein
LTRKLSVSCGLFVRQFHQSLQCKEHCYRAYYHYEVENAQYFKKTSRKTAADLNSDIQLEFVIDKKGTVKIVQLRVKTKL